MENYLTEIAKLTKSDEAYEIEEIQTLWSGYGKIVRVGLKGGLLKTVVAKYIILSNQNNHPKGWNTSVSHQRKVKSYEVEENWYRNYINLSDEAWRVPKCFGVKKVGEGQLIVLEDLDASGYYDRKSHLTIDETKLCLNWLANLHAHFMNKQPEGLWQVGTYWHLSTRLDEYKVMKDGELKENAEAINEILNTCKYKTFVHGDAKVANFCFSEDNRVAAVDFQYVGAGCGIKDVAYLLGSCLSEKECEFYEGELLNYYFKTLEKALNKTSNSYIYSDLHAEWIKLYPLAWADFSRFLMGWMPTHQKLNSYSKKQVNIALRLIRKQF